jgi:hypothetical protein
MAGCVAMGLISAGARAQTSQDSVLLITDALKVVGEITVGDTRATLEREFELEGGLQSAGRSRYVFKKCHLIKIEVEFSHKGDSSWTDFSPTDSIVHVSKPYLEYPITD